MFPQKLETLSADPIVQLRHVCKKIVIWLRTLYCWSRMLPSQALRGTTIGFSIYVVSEGNDDVSSLISNQGFLAQGPPSSVVTPYGELGWKVFYAPKSMVQRLLPQKVPYKTQSRPIPTPQANGEPFNRRESAPVAVQALSAPQNRHMHMRSHSALAPRSPQYQKQTVRSNSGLGPDPEEHDGGPPPSKNLSGLSLAMMLSDENIEGEKDSPTEANDQAEKRRAALHHAPPQLLISNNAEAVASPVMKRSLASAGEYGYAYNNHIPWQQIRPSNSSTTNNRASPFDTERTVSPSPLQVGTPPGYLGATPPTAGFWGGATPPINPSSLIRPRSAVTPPFVRPMGFVGEAPTQPFPPPTDSGALGGPKTVAPASSSHGAPPVASLDLLHSSPFQQQPAGSLLSSFSVYDPINANGSLGGDLRIYADSTFSAYEDHYHSQGDDEDDMPFAVDSPPATGPESDANGLASGSHSAAAVASFAQRCATANRLALFDSVQHQKKDQHDMVSSLVDQLAEFKTFGASLMNGKQPSDSAGDTSTTTPISLRT